MASLHDPTDPTHLTPDQRHDELAAILAVGVRRLLDHRASNPVSLPPESPENGLDVVAELSVHASAPVNTTGEHERSSR
jgi:hypothetical protein